MSKRWLPFVVGLIVASGVLADTGDQIVLYSGAINDGTYNESASRGVERFEKEHGSSIRSRVMPIGEDVRLIVDRLLAAGIDHFIALGGWWAQEALLEIAREQPEVTFTVVDAYELAEAPPNFAAISFREEEIAAMAGVVAGHHSKTHRIGFVGGMQIAPIERFCRGFVTGARSVEADLAFDAVYVYRDDPRGFRDRERAQQLTAELIDGGVDVVFGAAGTATLGVLRAADEKGQLAIGVDVNQNGLYPGSVLTSVVKRTDVAVFEALAGFADGTWEGGFRLHGLEDGYVELAIDQHNAALLEPLGELLTRQEEALRSSDFGRDDEAAIAACRP